MNCIVSILKDGMLLTSKTHIAPEYGAGEAIGSHSNFRIASVSKAMTAAVILILRDRHGFDIDTPVAEYLPSFRQHHQTITPRHLLNHTSGIWDYESLIPKEQTKQVTDEDAAQLAATKQETYFPPNTQYRYSNSGYVILSTIASRAMNTRFSDLMQSLIFAKIGMKKTVAFEPAIHQMQHRVFGHSFIDGKLCVTDQSVTSATLGDGGVYTNAIDFALWDHALNTNELLSSKSLEEMFTPATLENGEHTKYGFGWELGSINEQKCFYHTGSSIGFRSAVLKFPETNLTVFATSNIGNTDALAVAKAVHLEISTS